MNIMQDQMGNFIREMENMRKNQTEMIEMKGTITEKKTFKRLIGKLNIAKERVSELEDSSKEITQLKYKEGKEIEKKKSSQELCDSIKQSNCSRQKNVSTNTSTCLTQSL